MADRTQKVAAEHAPTTAAKPTAAETCRARRPSARRPGLQGSGSHTWTRRQDTSCTEIDGHEEPTDGIGFFWNAVWADGSEHAGANGQLSSPGPPPHGDHVMLDAFVHYVDTMGINAGKWIRRSDVEDDTSSEEEVTFGKKGAKMWQQISASLSPPPHATADTATNPHHRASSNPSSPGAQEGDRNVTSPRPQPWMLQKNAHAIVHYVPADTRDEEWSLPGTILEYELGVNGNEHMPHVGIEGYNDTRWWGMHMIEKPTSQTSPRADASKHTTSTSPSQTSPATTVLPSAMSDRHVTSPSSQSFTRVEDGEVGNGEEGLATSLASFDLDDVDDEEDDADDTTSTRLRRAAIIQQAQLLATCNAEQRRRMLQPNAANGKGSAGSTHNDSPTTEAEEFRAELRNVVDTARKRSERRLRVLPLWPPPNVRDTKYSIFVNP